METSGKPTEGWMTLVPLTVFIFIVIFALGGPTSFMNTVSNWVFDVGSYLSRWVRSL
jgi:hypothetical protein